MNFINLYMSLVALLGSSVYYLQAYKVFKRKSANDLALSGYLISLFTSANWLIYGYVIKDIPLISSGTISSIGAGLVLLGIFKFSYLRK